MYVKNAIRNSYSYSNIETIPQEKLTTDYPMIARLMNDKRCNESCSPTKEYFRPNVIKSQRLQPQIFETEQKSDKKNASFFDFGDKSKRHTRYDEVSPFKSFFEDRKNCHSQDHKSNESSEIQPVSHHRKFVIEKSSTDDDILLDDKI